MANPLYNAMNSNAMNNSMINQLRTFMSTYKGDPKAEVQNLINSGRMTQQQYNNLQQVATNMMKLLK